MIKYNTYNYSLFGSYTLKIDNYACYKSANPSAAFSLFKYESNVVKC